MQLCVPAYAGASLGDAMPGGERGVNDKARIERGPIDRRAKDYSDHAGLQLSSPP